MHQSDSAVLVFSEKFGRHSYGPRHPLKVERLQLTIDLMSAYGLLDDNQPPWVEAQEAQDQDLLLVHSPDYLQILKQANSGQTPSDSWRYGLGSGDNPVFPGLFDWSSLVTGATLECIRQVRDENRHIAFNISGGLHHAKKSRAAGFCYLNDPAIGIAQLLQTGLRVVYLDVDAHHGDGVEAAFYNTDQVLTISLHQHGHTLFPGTGFPDDMGEGVGLGYSVNVPLAPGTGDDLYFWAFEEVTPPLVHAFNPDILVTQLGVDSMAADPLASLNLTVNGFCRILQEIKSWGYKWVALGGGGYDLMNVARAWTKAWALMRDTEIPDTLPEAFVEQHKTLVQQNASLSVSPIGIHQIAAERAQQLARSVVGSIKENIFPLLGA